MTKQEAQNIPDLDIRVTELIEDAFYLKMAVDGRLSEEAGQRAANRLHKTYGTHEQLMDALYTADVMIDNLHKYGIACAQWCED